MNTVFETATHKIEINGTIDKTPRKIINMADFGELLPDQVLVELEDFKSNEAETPGKRQAAARMLIRIASGVQIDAYSDKLASILTKLVTHTSLTAEQATGILDALKQ